ncbi:MAG: ATP synthase F1 subunit epsilon [Verrucomicrobiota bacterium]
MPTRLEIVTPKGKAFSDEVDLVVVPGSEGELGVLPVHASLVSALQPGELRYTKGGEEGVFAIGEGVLEVTGKTVAILSDLAIGEEEIDESAVEEAMARAEKALEEKDSDGLDPDQVAALQLQVQKSLAQLKVKRRRKTV